MNIGALKIIGARGCPASQVPFLYTRGWVGQLGWWRHLHDQYMWQALPVSLSTCRFCRVYLGRREVITNNNILPTPWTYLVCFAFSLHFEQKVCGATFIHLQAWLLSVEVACLYAGAANCSLLSTKNLCHMTPSVPYDLGMVSCTYIVLDLPLQIMFWYPSEMFALVRMLISKLKFMKDRRMAHRLNY